MWLSFAFMTILGLVEWLRTGQSFAFGFMVFFGANAILAGVVAIIRARP
jgi:hypothetical protein